MARSIWVSVSVSSLVSVVVTLIVTTLLSAHPAEAQRVPARVEAQQFVVVDPNGVERAVLGYVWSGDPYTGRVDEYMGRLGLYGGEGGDRKAVVSAMSSSNGGHVNVGTPGSSQSGVQLGIRPRTGNGFIVVQDYDGQDVWSAP